MNSKKLDRCENEDTQMNSNPHPLFYDSSDSEVIWRLEIINTLCMFKRPYKELLSSPKHAY